MSRSWSIRATAGALLLFVALGAAQQLLVVHSPEEDAHPAVLFVTDLPLPEITEPLLAPEVEVTVVARPDLLGDCPKGTAFIEVNTQRLLPVPDEDGGVAAAHEGGYDMPETVKFVLIVFGPRDAAADVREASSNQARVDMQLNESLEVKRTTMTDGSIWSATMVSGEIRNMDTRLGGFTLQMSVDWLERRSAGSCYVHLPRLMGDAVQRGTFERFGLEQWRQWNFTPHIAPGARTAGLGTTRVVGAVGASVSRAAADNLPPPSDVVEASWRCFKQRDYLLAEGPDTRDCSALTVVTSSGLENRQLFYLFVLAALVGLGLQMVYEALTSSENAAKAHRQDDNAAATSRKVSQGDIEAQSRSESND